MPYCPHCRIDVATNNNKCPNCGTLLSMVPSIQVQAQKGRPMGVTIIGALAALGGIVYLLGGIGFLALAGVVSGYITSTSTITTSTTVLKSFGALMLALGVIFLALAWGYFTGKGWAWMVGMAMSVVSIALDIATYVITPSAGYLTTIVGALFPVIIIYYLTRPNVKSWFKK